MRFFSRSHRRIPWPQVMGNSLKLSLLGCFALPAMAQFAEPMLPVQPSQPEGFFPTLNDLSVLGGIDYPRATNFAGEGPDARTQVGSGLYEYTQPEENFYQRYDGFFDPLDQALGVFTNFDAWTIESQRLQNASLTIDSSSGILSRRFAPDQAHLKAGPLFLDVLWVGGGAVYSDYNGTRTFEGDNEDGWVSYVELSTRGWVRFTDTIYLTAVADLIYLPSENKFGLRLGAHDTPAILTRFNWSWTHGAWDFLFSNTFRGVPGLNFYADASSPAVDRAGRYFFGFNRTRNNEFVTDGQVYFSNRLGFKASRPLFDEQWRLFIDLYHTDFWRTFEFDEHSRRDRATVMLGYEGSILPFAPVLAYDIGSNDGFEQMWQRIMGRFSGRITENVTWGGGAGYRFTSGDNNLNDRSSFVWDGSLTHLITSKTTHWINFGENFLENEVVPETLTSRYVRYVIATRLNSVLSVRAFGQLAEGERLNDAVGDRQRWSLGASMTYRPLDFTSIRTTLMYEETRNRINNQGFESWLYRLELMQQLGFRLVGRMFYQFEDRQGGIAEFDEHMAGFSLRKLF